MNFILKMSCGRFSLIYNTGARHQRNELEENATLTTQVRHEKHECNTSETRVVHERHDCDMSATQMTRVWHESKILVLIATRVKLYFYILIFTKWQIKDYKERNNFILRTTFLHVLFPCRNAFKICTTKSWLFSSKSYVKKLYTRL